jgi:hypothetical protein
METVSDNARRMLNSVSSNSSLFFVSTAVLSVVLCLAGLAHAILLAAYGMQDNAGSLRETVSFELSSMARRQQYLERFIAEQASEIGSAQALDSQTAASSSRRGSAATAASTAAHLDADDLRMQTVEFDRCLERASNPKEYLEPIHIFALAHVLRRPIIVYGHRTMGGEHKGVQLREAHAEQAEERKDSDAAEAASSSQPRSQQLNSMVSQQWELRIDRVWCSNEWIGEISLSHSIVLCFASLITSVRLASIFPSSGVGSTS